MKPIESSSSEKLTLLRRIPSLIALRAFDSVARHGSCTKAATELNVSVAAVSQQIRLLEEFAGRELFRRHNRQLILNEAGASCLPELRKSFEHLISAMGQLNNHHARLRFNISVPPSFAVRWLIPNFKELSATAGDFDLWVSTALVPFHLADTNIDVAVIHGDGDFYGQPAELLMPALEVPVCSPAFLASAKIKSPEDLQHHVLIHEVPEVDDVAVPSWEKWLKERGVAKVDFNAGPRFTNPNLVIEAAITGLGVALSRGALVARDIEAGKLVQLFGPAKEGATGYYVVLNQRSEHVQFAVEFAERLKSLVRAPSAAPKGRAARGRAPARPQR